VLGAGGLVAVAYAAMPSVPATPSAAQCPTPRVSQWSGIRDTLWPQVVHRDGDDAWAHVDTTGLPRGSAAWCNPLAQDPDALAAGRDLYANACATCHGDAGRGDGPGGRVGDPTAYDFTRAAFAGTREPPGPALLYAIMTRGIEGTAMPGFPDLSGWERLALVAYIQRFPGTAAIGESRAWADSLRRRRT